MEIAPKTTEDPRKNGLTHDRKRAKRPHAFMSFVNRHRPTCPKAASWATNPRMNKGEAPLMSQRAKHPIADAHAIPPRGNTTPPSRTLQTRRLPQRNNAQDRDQVADRPTLLPLKQICEAHARLGPLSRTHRRKALRGQGIRRVTAPLTSRSAHATSTVRKDGPRNSIRKAYAGTLRRSVCARSKPRKDGRRRRGRRAPKAASAQKACG